MKYLVLLLLIVSQSACASARQLDDYHWVDVQRVVAVGDIHGDYENYLAVLQAAGVVDSRGKWAGGETHLVQTGDIPDRGPDTVRIIEHLRKLEKQARKKGGQVHSLMGNHEAMNVYGDLRYVTDEEFAAFANRNSAALRDRYFALVMQDLEARDPQAFAKLPEDFRAQWDAEHPLGWVEHRQAWDPAWNADGEFAEWALQRKVAIQINDSVFLHAGISGFYCQNSLESLTDKVHNALQNYDPAQPGILEDEFGPLWYRGMSGQQPLATEETVQAILGQHGAQRVVIGHTPTSGVIWPQYDGKVIQIDTGISAAYGGHMGYLEITPDGLFAGYPGGRLPLPAADGDRLAYLQQVIALDPENRYLQARLSKMQAPETPAAEAGEPESTAGGEPGDENGAPSGQQTGEPAATVVAVPTCGISQ